MPSDTPPTDPAKQRRELLRQAGRYESVTAACEALGVPRATFYRWHEVNRWSDERLSGQIRKDKIDILVDLSGHSTGNRLSVLATKPAPVQITAWGYGVGCGLRAMDYLIQDLSTFPVDHRGCLTEQVLDLPCQAHLLPLSDYPKPGPLPARSNGFITLGTFSRPDRLNVATFDLWAKVLQRYPECCLFWKASMRYPQVHDAWFKDQLGSRGIAHERLTVQGHSSQEEHLAAMTRVDFALDSYPHGGGVSHLELLRMGIPVVSRWGSPVTGRGTGTFLKILNMDNWIADSTEEYVAIVGQQMKNLDGLETLREVLRKRFDASILGDHRNYALEVERAYRLVWERWCLTNAG
ncbi:MAG: hypothetical protein HQL53_10565 [Magnetococcales bacterium]|nr:hypothetical protein [Magnetococcales bacterium]